MDRPALARGLLHPNQWPFIVLAARNGGTPLQIQADTEVSLFIQFNSGYQFELVFNPKAIEARALRPDRTDAARVLAPDNVVTNPTIVPEDGASDCFC